MKLVVNSSVIASAVTDAMRIASSTEDAYSGVLLTSSSIHGTTVQSYGDTTSFRRVLTVDELDLDEREDPVWYLPGKLTNRLLSRLPKDKPVTLESKAGWGINVRCGRIKAQYRLLDSASLPVFNAMPDSLHEVPGFAQQLRRVSFAAGKKGVISGVHIDGKKLTATNQQMLATVACEVPVDRSVVVPVGKVLPLIRTAGSVAVGLAKHRLVFHYDQTTIATSLYTDPYPKVDDYIGLIDKFDDATSTFNRAEMRMALDRMVAIGDEDDNVPWVRVRFTDDSIRLGINVEGVGEAVDEISANNTAAPKLTYTMALPYLREVLDAWSKPEVVMGFCSSDNLKVFSMRDDDDGYTVLWMPVRDPNRMAI